MTGLFGIAHWDGAQVCPRQLVSMDAALAPWGPAGGFQEILGCAGLGLRLSINAEEDKADRQPLRSADGQSLFVFAGRLDNREEVLEALPGWESGSSAGVPDSRIALAAYESFGEPFLERLVGCFALAIWNRSDRSLRLARSPFVAPPVFYHTTARTLAFATHPGALFVLPHIPRRIFERKLADMLVRSPADPEGTLYEGIARLPTGCWLRASEAGIRVHPFWTPDLASEIRFPRDEDYAEAFRELLDRVVRGQLRGLGEVGVMLSGGLDSSAVAATAAGILDLGRRRLFAFTEVPPEGYSAQEAAGRYADETPLVTALARRYPNLDLERVDTSPETFLDRMEDRFATLDRPFLNDSNMVWIEAILRSASRKGVGNLLDGDWGNLAFSRSGAGLLPDLLGRGRWLQAWREASLQARRQPAGNALRTFLGQGVLPCLGEPLHRRVLAWSGRTDPRSPACLQRISPIAPGFALEHQVRRRAEAMPGTGPAAPALLERWRNYQALALQDSGPVVASFEARFGVVLRSPLADPRLVSFCLRMPEHQYQRGGQTRYLVRRALVDRVPEAILANEARGIQAADTFVRLSGIRGPMLAELDRIGQCALARQALDLPRLGRMLEHWPEGATAVGRDANTYCRVLERGLTVGRFLSWFEKGS